MHQTEVTEPGLRCATLLKYEKASVCIQGFTFLCNAESEADYFLWCFTEVLQKNLSMGSRHGGNFSLKHVSYSAFYSLLYTAYTFVVVNLEELISPWTPRINVGTFRCAYLSHP